MRKKFSIILSMFSLFLCLSAVAFGQETTGNIEGTVKDQTGAVVPNVNVTVTSVSGLDRTGTTTTGVTSGFKRSLSTDSNGFFRAVQVPAGVYKVTTDATSGFGAATYDNVTVTLGKTTQLNIEVSPGSASATVDVGSTDTPVDTTGSEISTSINAQKLQLLPKGVDFTSALKASPGTRPDTVAGGFSVDGATNAENTFVIDGQEVTNYNHAGVNRNNQIPFQLVQELQVKSSGFDAEYGGATGGVINVVTKGGSNDFHGEFGVQFRTDRLDANPRPILVRFANLTGGPAEYVQPSKPKYTHFFPTANMSGPIIKDRLWFFGSWSPQIFDQTNTVTFYRSPTNALPDRRFFLGESKYSSQQTFEYGFARLDAQPFNQLRMSATYLWNPSHQEGLLPIVSSTNPTGTVAFQAPEAPINYGPGVGFVDAVEARSRQGGRNNANNVTFQTVYTPSSNFIGSFRWSRGFLNEKGNNYFVPSGNQYSCVVVGAPPAGTVGCPAGNSPATTATVRDVSVRKSWEADATTMFNAGGRHQLKGGYQRSTIFNDLLAGFNQIVFLCYKGGSIACTHQDNGFQWQAPSTVTNNAAAVGVGALQRFGQNGKGSNLNQSIYVQDKWQPTSRLTINAGVRVEKEDIPSYNQFPATFNFTWGDKLAPRFGAAYDVFGDGRTKIFGSYGHFFDRLKFHLAQGSFGGDFYRVDFFDIMPGTTYTNFTTAAIVGNFSDPIGGACQANGFIGSGLSRCQIDLRIASNDPDADPLESGAIDPNMKPYEQREMTVGVEHTIGRNFVLRGRYTDKKLLNAIEDSGISVDGSEVFITGNPGQGLHLQFLEDGGYARSTKPTRSYRAMELVLEKRLSDNYYFNVNYTLSRLFGNYSGLSNTDELTCRAASEYNGCARSDPGVNRSFDLPFMGFTATGDKDDGRLATDRPHVVNAFGAYIFDWNGSKSNSTEVSAFQTFQSGAPLTTFISFDGATTIFTKRGDLGRMPMFSQTDLGITHRYRFGKDQRFSVVGDLNILNLWDQKKPITFQTTKTVSGVALTTAFPIAQFPGLYTDGDIDQAKLVNAYTSGALLAPLNAYFAADPNRTISTYGLANRYQDVRQVRFGLRFLF